MELDCSDIYDIYMKNSFARISTILIFFNKLLKYIKNGQRIWCKNYFWAETNDFDYDIKLTLITKYFRVELFRHLGEKIV